MVLDPKTHNEYGTIYTTDILPRTFINQKGGGPLSPEATQIIVPEEDDDDDHASNKTPCHLNGEVHAAVPPAVIATATTVSPATTDEHSSSAVSSMNSRDLHQRQPLIPTPGHASPERWTSQKDTSSILGNDFYEDDDSGDDSGVGKKPDHHVVNIVPNGLPPHSRDEEPRFPKEKCKTFIAFMVMIVNFLMTTASLAVIHERVPDRDKYPPLSDVFLDHVQDVPSALNISEYIIVVLLNSAIAVCIFHKHRFIVFRRLFVILSLLYLMRSITMFVTVLPMSSTVYYCSPKSNNTSTIQVLARVVQLFSGMGLSINGKHSYCGDYIYSGHTVVLVISSLVISEYTPRKLYLLHWLVYILAFTGVLLILVAHGHYTIDVIIAYYVTTRIFWMYHTLANNPALKSYSQYNYLSRTWWFPFFLIFERNVGGVVPLQYDWPLPWPRRFLSKHPNRNS